MSCTIDVGSSGRQVTATFHGHLTDEEGRVSAMAFGQTLGAHSVDVVWDLREMSGYDSGAREAWQEAIWPNRRSIRSLTLIGARPTVRVGAMMLAIFLGAPWRFLDTPEAEAGVGASQTA